MATKEQDDWLLDTFGLDVSKYASDAVQSTVGTVVDFGLGLGEGVKDGVVGLAGGMVDAAQAVGHGMHAAGTEAVALATDPEERRRAGEAIRSGAVTAADMVESGAKATADFAAKAWNEPGATAREIAAAAFQALDAIEKAVRRGAEEAAREYEEAGASGHGARFLGHAAGEGVAAVGSLFAGGELLGGVKIASIAVKEAVGARVAKAAQALKAIKAARRAAQSEDPAKITQAMAKVNQATKELAEAEKEEERVRAGLSDAERNAESAAKGGRPTQANTGRDGEASREDRTR